MGQPVGEKGKKTCETAPIRNLSHLPPSLKLADVGYGWFVVERERTSGNESIVFKYLARGWII